jgi:hypothetical protein
MDQEEIEVIRLKWNDVNLERIRRFCGEEGVEFTQDMAKAEIIDRLANLGIHAFQAFRLPGQQPVQQPLAQDRHRRARLELRKQLALEEITDFIKHADLFFDLDGTEEHMKVAHLASKVNTNVSVVIEDLHNSGVTNYQQICERLLGQFSVSRFDRLARFRSMRPTQGENLIQYGAKLRAEYLKYVLIVENQAAPMEQALVAALMEQLFITIDADIASRVRNKITENPQLAWLDILKITENYRQTSIKATSPAFGPVNPGNYLGFAGQSPRPRHMGGRVGSFGQPAKQWTSQYRQSRPSSDHGAYCDFHQRTGHATADCFDKKKMEALGQQTASSTSETTHQSRCYNCNQEGHFARLCPQRSENDKPDRTSPESSELAQKRQPGSNY